MIEHVSIRFIILAAEYTAVSGFEIIIGDRWNLVLFFS